MNFSIAFPWLRNSGRAGCPCFALCFSTVHEHFQRVSNACVADGLTIMVFWSVMDFPPCGRDGVVPRGTLAVISLCPINYFLLYCSKALEKCKSSQSMRRFSTQVAHLYLCTYYGGKKKKPRKAYASGAFMWLPTGFVPSPLPIARKGECEGGTLAGSPARVQSPGRRRALLRSKSAAPETKPPLRGGFVSVMRDQFRYMLKIGKIES